jgi:uncharacterized repeat protein (TIGR01451 family)
MRKILVALAFSAVSHVAAADVELSVAIDASADQVLSGSNVTYTITVSNDDTDAAPPFVVTDTLPAEATLVSCSATGTGACAGSSVSFHTLAGGASETITIVATVNCCVKDGTDIVSIAELHPSTPDPDADEVENDSVTVTVVNPPPKVTNASVTPSQLWPPNHKMTNVAVNYTIEDNCGPVTVTLSVTSNEPINGTGDGDTAPDWIIVDDHRVQLRAERAGTGTSRVYTITITATDCAGHSGSTNVTVTVPHDRG